MCAEGSRLSSVPFLEITKFRLPKPAQSAPYPIRCRRRGEALLRVDLQRAMGWERGWEGWDVNSRGEMVMMVVMVVRRSAYRQLMYHLP